MKSLIEFSHKLLDDVGQWCGVCTTRDGQTIAARIEHEGLSFLTITLPAFCKDFERSLEQGRVADDAFPGFARVRGLPRFLGGFLQLVFDRNTGVLLDVPSVLSVRAIRQFTLAFAKIEMECAPHRVDSAFRGYIECEQDVQNWNNEDHSELLTAFTRASSVLYSGLFTDLDRKIESGELVPKHGPGSTADRVSGNAKYHVSAWSESLDQVFPLVDWVLPNARHWDYLVDVNVFEPGSEPPVRVITVPKTMKTPRIIALEPHFVQYAQQAIKEQIYEYVERDDILSSLIGFEDQAPNRVLAQRGSLTGEFATLDLSEASDRVSLQHVAALLAWHPSSREAVMACRSSKADVPGYGEIPLAKFASMGSALCFPMEAMVFLTIVFMAIASELNTPVSAKLVRELRGSVRVYGDDIIVPVDYAPSVTRFLEAFGLKVNTRKSFSTGEFRESCGGDYFRGHWVTPVRVKSCFPESRKHVDEIVSTVALRNHLYEIGCESSVEFLDRILDRILPVYPEIPVGHSSLGRWTYEPVKAQRFHPGLQTPLIKACEPKYLIPSDGLDEVGGLMKFFLRRGAMPLSKDAFIRAGRPVSARITTRWAPL